MVSEGWELFRQDAPRSTSRRTWVVRYTCRDRTMPRMISDLLGAAAAGIRNVLLVSGDLTATGPYPDHTAVFDIDSIGLTNLLDHLNRGVDPAARQFTPLPPSWWG